MDLKMSFWESTYHRNIKKMIGICFRYVSDRQIAKDLAHDAFLKAIQKADTFKGKGHFEAWLRRITVNTALQHLRNEKVKNENQRELYYHDLINNDGEMDKWQDFTTQELMEAINILPEHHRLVFNLYVIDKFPHKQIAEKLNISEGTSKSHLARARKKLQLILNNILKKKEKKRAFMFIIFPFGFGRIDMLYRSRFSNYEIKPQSTSFLDNFDWSNQNQPKFNKFHNFSIASAVVGLTAILITIYMLNMENESKFTKEENPVIPIDTVLKQKDIDTVIRNTDTSFEIKTQNKHLPVIIKKKRVIHEKFIVRDTLTIIDTTNAK